MTIPQENRREAYYEIQPDVPTRKWHIVQTLKQYPEGLTAEAIGEKLMQGGVLRFYTDNAIRPRLTELYQDGLIEPVGRQKGRTGRTVTVWSTTK